MSPRRTGFSLVELMVVIAIIVILMVIVGVSWNKLTSSRMEFNAINTVKGAIRGARARAMELGTDVAVIFDHTGQGAIYRYAPFGDPAYDPELATRIFDSGPSVGAAFIRENLFVRDTEIRVGELEKDVKLAKMSFVEPPLDNSTVTMPEDLNTPPLHVAFCFDSGGRLRVRPIVALIPSVDFTLDLTMTPSLHLYGLDQWWMSQVGCVGFRGTQLEAAVGPAANLGALQAWLLNPDVGATLVVNRWTGRSLPGPEAE